MHDLNLKRRNRVFKSLHKRQLSEANRIQQAALHRCSQGLMHRSTVLPLEDRCSRVQDARKQTNPCADFFRMEFPRGRFHGAESVRRVGDQETPSERRS